MNDREERLERHLQAMSALNRRLHAQLGGARRSAVPDEWFDMLEAVDATDAHLVRGARGQFLVEGGLSREIRSSLLAAALADRLGHERWIDESELNRLSEGPPVEVLEGPYGLPFVVVGGRRLPLRGLPLPHPVSTEEMQRFAQYDELNIASANVPRARLRLQIYRVRSAVARKGGFAPAARVASERIMRRLRAVFSRVRR